MVVPEIPLDIARCASAAIIRKRKTHSLIIWRGSCPPLSFAAFFRTQEDDARVTVLGYIRREAARQAFGLLLLLAWGSFAVESL
ncbi:hypothetical protein MASR1M66_01990 [Aminivibrio sp.]